MITETSSNILHSVEIYNKDNSYEDYNGENVTFSIKKNDGIIIEIMAYNPFIVIDGDNCLLLSVKQIIEDNLLVGEALSECYEIDLTRNEIRIL